MRLLIFCCLIVLVACREESKTPSASILIVQNQTALYDAPGKKSRELRPLKAGERLRETGMVSDFVTSLALGDTLYQAPWIQVQTSENQTGWVFSATLRPQEGDADAWFLQQQMRCFFGPGLTNRRNNWLVQRASGLTTETEFARDYREALALRDTLMGRLAARAEPNEADVVLNFYWLDEVLPGFVFQMVAEGTQPYLFADYHDWQRKALKTSGEQDDHFIAAALLAFSADSIESFFPAWQQQTWDYGGSSQLGLGRHLSMLRVIDVVLAGGNLFEPELLAFKDRLLNDILDQNTTFWQPVEKIRTELDAILAANLRCLSDRDRLALSERRKAFDNPATNDIRVNLRAGE